MIEKLIFETPLKYAAGLQSGELVRFGAIIKESASGKIVGHIQETGLSQLAEIGGSMLSPMTSVSSLAANAQLANLTNMVDLLKSLQLADLSLGVIGVGLSVANLKVMSEGFKEIQGRFDQLSEQMQAEFAALRLYELQKDQQKIAEALVSLNDAHKGQACRTEFSLIRDRVKDYRGNLNHGIRALVASNKCDLRLLEGLVTSLLMANNCIIHSLLLEDQMFYAQREAQTHSKQLNELLLPLTPVYLARKQWSPREKVIGEKYAWKKQLDTATKLVEKLRRTQDLVASRPLLLSQLKDTGIGGPEYLEQFQTIKSEPLVFLPVSQPISS